MPCHAMPALACRTMRARQTVFYCTTLRYTICYAMPCHAMLCPALPCPARPGPARPGQARPAMLFYNTTLTCTYIYYDILLFSMCYMLSRARAPRVAKSLPCEAKPNLTNLAFRTPSGLLDPDAAPRRLARPRPPLPHAPLHPERDRRPRTLPAGPEPHRHTPTATHTPTQLSHTARYPHTRTPHHRQATRTAYSSTPSTTAAPVPPHPCVHPSSRPYASTQPHSHAHVFTPAHPPDPGHRTSSHPIRPTRPSHPIRPTHPGRSSRARTAWARSLL